MPQRIPATGCLGGGGREGPQASPLEGQGQGRSGWEGRWLGARRLAAKTRTRSETTPRNGECCVSTQSENTDFRIISVPCFACFLSPLIVMWGSILIYTNIFRLTVNVGCFTKKKKFSGIFFLKPTLLCVWVDGYLSTIFL